ncbi:MAG: hypothetical protein AB9897_04050 [Anaerolineaceae bacterium]
MFLLIAATFLQKLLWVEPGGIAINPWIALKDATINSFMVWSLFCVFFFALAGIFKRAPNLLNLTGLVGAAGAPLVITTTLSAFSWWVASWFELRPILSTWLFVQNSLSWIGLILGWTGIFGYLLLHEGLKIPRTWAILFSVIALGFLIAGKIVPLL